MGAEVVTSENLNQFNAIRLRLPEAPPPAAPAPAAATPTPSAAEEAAGDGAAKPEAQAVGDEAAPVVETEQEGEEHAAPKDAPEQPKEEPKEPAHKERKGNPKIEQRFSELSAKARAAEERAETERAARENTERELRELRAKLEPKPEAPAVDPDIGPEPQATDYTDAFEFAKDLAKWSSDKAAKEAVNQFKREAEEAKQREAAQKVQQAWAQRLTAAKAEIPDFEEMVASSPVTVSDDVRDAIIESEVGPKILYHLAEHPDVAEKLSGMNVKEALREIGRIEARLEKPPAPVVKAEPEPKPKVIEAKPKAEVITPIKAKAVPDNKIDASGNFTGTYAEFKALRQAGKIN